MPVVHHSVGDALLAARDVGLPGRGSVLVVISLVFTGIALSLVISRITTRFFSKGAPGADDIAIVFSVTVATVMTAMNCIAVNHGFGKHSVELSISDHQAALKDFLILQVLYKVTINATKTSILLLYLRIFPGRPIRCATYVVMAYVISYAVASVIVTIAQCLPVPYFWDRSLHGHCINPTAFWYANAAANILGDIVILLLPIPSIYNLHLQLRQKIGLMVIFGLGGFVCVTSVLRMTTLDSSSKSPDPTYGSLVSTVWTTIEANTGIICACLPMLKQPLVKIWPRLFGSFTDTGSDGTSERATTSQNSVGLSYGRSIGNGPTREERRFSRNNGRRRTHIPLSAINHSLCALTSSVPIPARSGGNGFGNSEETTIVVEPFSQQAMPMGVINKTTNIDVEIDERRRGSGRSQSTFG